MRNPRGRPPLDRTDPSTRVTVALPNRVYDALAVQALREGTSVAEVIRRGLRRRSDDTPTKTIKTLAVSGVYGRRAQSVWR